MKTIRSNEFKKYGLVLDIDTKEIVEYLKAMSVVEITGSEIINNSNEELWFLVEGNIVCLEPKTSFRR